MEINQLLQKIHYYSKREKCDDTKEWIDRMTNEGIYQKFLTLYTDCEYSFIEVSF